MINTMIVRGLQISFDQNRGTRRLASVFSCESFHFLSRIRRFAASGITSSDYKRSHQHSQQRSTPQDVGNSRAAAQATRANERQARAVLPVRSSAATRRQVASQAKTAARKTAPSELSGRNQTSTISLAQNTSRPSRSGNSRRHQRLW